MTPADAANVGSSSAKAPVKTGEELLQISQSARRRLAQMSRTDIGECKDSFLFRDDIFCGMKFRIGPFWATWMAGEEVIRFFREMQAIGLIELQPGQAKAA